MSKTTIKKADCKAPETPPQNRALLRTDIRTLPTARPDPMKRRPGSLSRGILSALCIFNFAFLISAQATITVTGLVSQITSEALETKITFTPAADILLLTNGLSAGPAKTISSASNGGFTNTFNPGTYLVRLPLVGGRNAFTIAVPHGNGIENITNLIAAPWTYEQFVNTVSSGGTSGALTNNETRTVTFRDQLTLGTVGGFQGDLILHDGVSGSANIDYSAGEVTISSGVRATGGFLGDGSELTALSGSAITSGTISSNKMDATAHVAYANDVTQAGLAAGSISGKVTSPQTSFTEWELVRQVLRTNSAVDSGGLRVSTAIRDASKLAVYYAGYTNPITTLGGSGNQGGHIIGWFGQSWETLGKHGVVLERGAGGQWDSGNIGGCRVFNFGTATNYMYYFAGVNTTWETGLQEIGVAYTTDGTNFTKYASNPILTVGSSGEWDDVAIQGGVHVEYYNGTYFMYFGGLQLSPDDESVGLAFSTSPLGPWTKHSSNPVLNVAGSIAVEPSVFPLGDNRGWGMIVGAGYATSTNLTNWTFVASLTISTNGIVAGVPGFPGVVLSPFIFDDNGMAALFDDVTGVFLARPKIASPYIPDSTLTTNKLSPEAYVALMAANLNGVRTTNLVNTSSGYGRSIKANEFPYTFMTVQSNLPLRVLTVGDSVTAKGETTPALRAAFASRMASAGFGSTYGNDHQIAQDSVLFAQSGGLSTTASDSHTTHAHFHLSNGQQYISSGTEVLANKLTIYYYADGAAGTMLVETQALGGSYGTLATIDSALGTAHIATNFTLNTREYYRFRITSTGNNYLLDVGLTDTTAQRSQTWATKSTPGDLVTNIIYTPAFWNFFTNYNPHLIIIEAKDTADSILPAMDWFRNNATNSDIVYVSPSPNSDDAGLPAQCDAMFRYARTNTGISVFDKHALFYPTNHWIPITYEDSAHLNYKGVIRASQAFADWFNVDDSKFGVGGKTNVQYFTALDARLVSAGSMQTTLPVNPNEVFYGGLSLLSPGYIMISGAPRGIGLILPPELIRGKKNIAISQRWLTTNAQLIAHSSVLHRLSFDDVGRREKQGTTGGNVLYAGTGTNLMNYRVLNTFTQPAREGDYIYCELGHGGTLTNSIWWMGCKVEAY